MDWLAVIHADNLVTIYIAAFHINSLLAIHTGCTTAFRIDFLIIIHAGRIIAFHVDFLVIIHARCTTIFHVDFLVAIHAGRITAFHVDFLVAIHARCTTTFQVGFPVIIHAGRITVFHVDFPVTIHARCITTFHVDFLVIIHAGCTTAFRIDFLVAIHTGCITAFHVGFPVIIHARRIIAFRVDSLVIIHAGRITVFPLVDSAPPYCRRCRRSCFCRCFHRTFLTASPSLTAGSGTLLGKFTLISHHLVQIQTSEIPVLCNEKQIEVFNKMLQIFHGSSPLIGQQIQFVKIMFVFLLFAQKQYRFKIQPQPHAFHVGIQLHHFVIRHQTAIQPDKLLCIIHFFCVLV